MATKTSTRPSTKPARKRPTPHLVWNLRMVCARRGIWKGADLRRLLITAAGYDLSAASISTLLTKDPSMIRIDTLHALCYVLECTPNDLFVTEEEFAAQFAGLPAPDKASA